MNAEQLQDILRKHELWLADKPGGERADLQGANLRGANLRGANLWGANIIIAGQDVRGYLFYAYPSDDGVEVRAGCRQMSLDDALQHWSVAHADDPILQADLYNAGDMSETVAVLRLARRRDGGE